MQKLNHKKIHTLHTLVLRWCRKHQRELVWRTTHDPYEILVSEIMLQQTQVSRVQEKLPVFLKKFPTIRSLARASSADVIHAWRGMGYNNRAVRLRDLAKTVVKKYRAKLPSDVIELQSLPGIGPYTAHALACFAFRKQVPVVDVNIQRVLSRVFWKMADPRIYKETEVVWRLAEKILPINSYAWNQALMDIGATICTARKPQCDRCPVSVICSSKNVLRQQTQQPRSEIFKREPMYKGAPRRIWRGKIVEALRNVNGKGFISINRLGKTIMPSFKKDEMPWLDSLVGSLQRDGIVSRVRSNIMLSQE